MSILCDNGDGITCDSLNFYYDNKDKFTKFICAYVKDYEITQGSKDKKYKLMLMDSKGDRMYLSGVASGYGGEGARGLYEVLRDAGFCVKMEYIMRYKYFSLP